MSVYIRFLLLLKQITMNVVDKTTEIYLKVL